MGTSEGYSILLFLWTMTIIIGHSSPTLLKPCEGENLQDCVKGAESILLDTNMTFPDDNETLQSVCSLWDEMRDCAYNYTARCLTPKENQEFHQYFHKPMSSMRKICTDPNSTQEYFRHAHCIKTISTVDRFCGAEYQLLITEILSINVNTMKKICCALSDFKDCVVQKDADHVCGDGPDHDHETDGDISSYALKTLEKSLLAFVTHSCTKEGFDRSTCLADGEERLGAASNEVESILIGKERPPGGGGGMRINQSPTSSTHNQLPMQSTTNSFGLTQKTLLVPVFTSSTTGPEFHSRIAVNVSSTGEKGKISTSIIDGKIKMKANENAVYKSTVRGSEASLNAKLTENLEAKIRNASLFWSKKDPNPTLVTTTEGDAPHAEKRVEILAPLTNGANLNSTSIKPHGNSRSGHGRALNLVSSLEDDEVSEKSGDETIQNDLKTNANSSLNSAQVDSSTLPKNPPTSATSAGGEIATTASASSADSPQSGSQVPTVIASPSTPSVTTTQEKVKDSPSSSGSNTITAPAPSSSSPSTLSSTTTTAKPTTTTKKVAMGMPGGMKNNILESGVNSGKKKILSSMYNATRAGDSKNKSNVSLSDVPIRVFLIWLSTFFV